MTLALVEPTRTEWRFPKEHLSPSQVYMMTACGACYELAYVRGIPQPPSANLAVGSAVHAAVQRQREYLLDGVYDQRAEHLRMAAFMDAASESFDSDVEYAASLEPQEEWPVNSTTDLTPHKDTAMKVARFAVNVLEPIDRAMRIVAVEQRVWGLGIPLSPTDDHYDGPEEAALMADLGIEPVFPFPFVAKTDVIGELLGERMAKCDLKTSADSRKPDWWPKVQLTLYSMPDDRNGLDVALRVDQVTKQERPQFFSHWMTDVTPEWRQKVVALVMGCAEDISAGRFRMRPSYACTFSHRLPGLSAAVDGFA